MQGVTILQWVRHSSGFFFTSSFIYTYDETPNDFSEWPPVKAQPEHFSSLYIHDLW